MKKKFYILLCSVAIIFITLFIYAYFLGTKGLKVNEIKIINNKLPDYFHGFKVVHISDIHYGRIINEKNMDNVVHNINMTKPDIVVLTGDLLDRDRKLESDEKNTLIKFLGNINSKIGKYAISGNHDTDYGLEEWQYIIEKSNFINLNNNFELIYNEGNLPIFISGLSSNLNDNNNSIQKKLSLINKFLNDTSLPNSKIPKPVYNIMLLHEPDFIDELNTKNYNLILAGHSHNGQIKLPYFGALIKPIGAKKYYDEHYNIDNTDLYISSGLGTSTLDIRLFNKPSFNFYRLTKQ